MFNSSPGKADKIGNYMRKIEHNYMKKFCIKIR